MSHQRATLGIHVRPPVSQRVSDWLRAPTKYGWAVKTGRGRYRVGEIPKSSLRRMRRIAAAQRALVAERDEHHITPAA